LPPAEEVLKATGVSAGLAVVVGTTDGKLEAGLGEATKLTVQGLAASDEATTMARQHITQKGLYGRTSVARFGGARLPHADDLANLLIVEDPSGVGMDEVLRVLAPLGVAYTKQGGAWIKTVKPWPREIDEWTHWRHDAGNGGVARDTRVGPPKRMQWIAEPPWSRGHECPTSTAAAVTAGGRLYYVFDEGQTGVYTLPARWTLVARDAFNGVLLWKRPVPEWGPLLGKGARASGFQGERLVADRDYVYVLPGGEALTIVDARTGEVVKQAPTFARVSSLRCADGLLVMHASSDIVALETSSWKTRWRIPADELKGGALALGRGRAVFCTGRAGDGVAAIDARDGKQLWRAKVESGGGVVLHERIVLAGGFGQMTALDLDTGKVLWKADLGAKSRPQVIGGLIWSGSAGYDPATGEKRQTAKPASGDQMSSGHHPRCYPPKATDRYIISNFRGAEFIGVPSGEVTINDWLRGSCGHGVMPANGLLYAPPSQCFCYSGAMLPGFKALAAAAAIEEPAASPTDAARLTHGPAYADAQRPTAKPAGKDAWPMYRRDPARSGFSPMPVAPDVGMAWTAKLGGRLTPPVVADRLLLVAARDAHTVYAMDADDGTPRWQFTADARIDSAPSLHEGLVYFGSADGRAHCLRAADGKLVWRFGAAPRERWIGSHGQVESAWPVHGSVGVMNNAVYLTAGRATYLDGGIHAYALELRSGRVLHHALLKDEVAATPKKPEGKSERPFVPAFHTEGARSDLLVSDGEFLYMGPLKLDAKLQVRQTPYIVPGDAKVAALDLAGAPYVNPEILSQNLNKRDGKADLPLLGVLRGPMGDKQMGLRLFATGGFLDDSGWNRTYWMHARIWPGYYIANLSAKAGQLLCFDEKATYAVQYFTSRTIHSPTLEPGTKGYLLFADDNDNEPVLDDRTRGRDKGLGYGRRAPPKWHLWVPLRIRAMTVAGGTLFVAGTPDVVPKEDPYAAIDGRRGARLWAVSATDGRKLNELPLDAEPVFDGLIAAGGRLYVSLGNGQVHCLAAKSHAFQP
jgi:outer membrane protein assembly factor BamB